MDNGFDKTHILVVDDDRRTRDLLKLYLVREGYRASAAQDAAHAARLMQAMRFDLLILDIMMPGLTGLEFARSLPASAPPVLFLTAKDRPDERIEGLEAGAQDYLGKPFEPRELLLRIENILARNAPDAEADEVRLGEAQFSCKQARLSRAGKPVALNAGEQALLLMFARAPGRIFTRAEIAARHGIGSERAVDVRINRLRQKIEINPHQPLYLQTVRGEGYVLKPGA